MAVIRAGVLYCYMFAIIRERSMLYTPLVQQTSRQNSMIDTDATGK